MSRGEFDPELDLVVERVIRAPRAGVWRAWSDPDRFAQWWVPAPAVCRVVHFDLSPGGALVTELSDDGTAYVPHLDASFLVVEELERLVFTNAIDSNWRPVTPDPFLMTAEVVFAEHPEGTDYRIVVRHGTPAARARHEELGFADGWGTVTKQLATLAESEVARLAADHRPGGPVHRADERAAEVCREQHDQGGVVGPDDNPQGPGCR